MNILLIEDNYAHALLVARVFEDYPTINQIYHLTDGAEAMDFILQRGEHSNSPRPDLIFLDIRLPKVNGLSILQTIRESEAHRDLRVVILTTSSINDEIEQARLYHVDAYLTKPFTRQHLTQVVDQFINSDSHVI